MIKYKTAMRSYLVVWKFFFFSWAFVKIFFSFSWLFMYSSHLARPAMYFLVWALSYVFIGLSSGTLPQIPYWASWHHANWTEWIWHWGSHNRMNCVTGCYLLLRLRKNIIFAPICQGPRSFDAEALAGCVQQGCTHTPAYTTESNLQSVIWPWVVESRL